MKNTRPNNFEFAYYKRISDAEHRIQELRASGDDTDWAIAYGVNKGWFLVYIPKIKVDESLPDAVQMVGVEN